MKITQGLWRRACSVGVCVCVCVCVCACVCGEAGGVERYRYYNYMNNGHATMLHKIHTGFDRILAKLDNC